MIRSALFVPATRTDRIGKALATGADAVIVDLEDAVATEVKSQAREDLVVFLQNNPDVNLWVRVNGAQTQWFEEDVHLCARFLQIKGVMLPKAEHPEQIAQIFHKTGKAVYPIIESAKGIGAIPDIARAQGVARLSFGALDLGVDLGLENGSEGAAFLLNQMRAQLVVQSRVAGIDAPLDGVYPNFKDSEGLRQSMTFAKGMGFAGALCIHPSQVEVIHSVMSYSEEEIRWAKAVLEKYQETGLAAFSFEGKMVDMPVIERAKRLVSGR
ncbi:HpcH/HpaI aldolase/citrate lyase family protein [Pelistega europaea]|nr:CoA ester lyase [Pelistega europaea]